MEYYIYATNSCNLNCEYCSVLFDCKNNNMPIDPIYSLEDLSQFVQDRESKNQNSELSVYFFGGEPTLNFEFIDRLIQELETKIINKKIKFVLHTNGLLLKEIPKSIAEKINLVMHSVNYEKIPKYHLGNSYFSELIDNLQHFRKISAAKIIGRFTITENTSLYTEVMQFSHFYDFAYWQIQNCQEFINFKDFYNTYTYELNLLFKYWLGYFEQGICLNYIPFISCVKFMLDHDRCDTDFACGYGRSMVYVQTDGSCYSCCDSVANKQHHIGDIYNGIRLESPSLLKFRCKDCRYRCICMGRCGRMHKEFSKKHISQYCALNKYMFGLFKENSIQIENSYRENRLLFKFINDKCLEATEFIP